MIIGRGRWVECPSTPLVLYPATWIAAGVAVGYRLGAVAGLLAGLAGFLLAAAAVAFEEGSEPIRIMARLGAEREALRAELLEAAALIPADAGGGALTHPETGGSTLRRKA